jgi:hypothetical protein
LLWSDTLDDQAAQRLHHLHDERAGQQPEPDRIEIRRIAFNVASVIYELDAVAFGGDYRSRRNSTTMSGRSSPTR